MQRRRFVQLLPCAAARALGGEAEVSIRSGWDWSLPEGIKPVPYSGFVTWGKKRFSEMITVSGIQATWRLLCPAPGEYNWQPLRDAMEEARSLGMRIGLHVKGVERQSVPDWVIAKYNVPVLDVSPLQQNQPWRLQIVPPWNPDVKREYVKFMEAFGKTGIPQMADVVYGYIHGISPSRGEELFLRSVDIEDFQKKAGMTPDLLADCLRSRLDAMLSAYRGVEYKLAWMAGGPIAATMKQYQEYARKTAGLLEYAIGHGTGWRGGGVDFQHGLFRSEALGASITPDGYCVIDESLPIHAETRYVGDENEEYGKYWEWRFGPVEKHDYRHRICTLRTLQLRQNFQMVSPETLRLNPELNQYALLTQGRRAANSPDAWAYLRECAIKSGNAPLAVKNLERWLIQRDVTGHTTVPCERVDRFPLSADPPGRNYDFDARRTDIRNGQRGMAFQLDTKFWNQPGPALVKVTFIDREPAKWRIESSGADGQRRTTASVASAGDGARKTASVAIQNLAANRAFPGDSDFCIANEGPGDVAVTMVRVLKGDWKKS